MPWKIKISGSFFIALIFLFVALSLSIFLFSKGENYSDIFSAENGEMHLSSSDFKYNILLDGEWKFYNHQLLTSPDDATDPYRVVRVPHIWNGTGYGTYHLIVKGLIKGEHYCLYAPDITSAYNLYFDSKLVAQNGQVGTDIKTERLHWEPQIVFFTAENEKIEILMQVSNFHAYPGGFIREMKLGLTKNMITERTRNLSNQMILFGGILIIALYNLSLFLLNTKDLAALYFSLFNFMVASRIAVTGEKIINIWLTSPDWELLLKAQFVIGSSMLGLFVLFMNMLFKKEFNIIIMRVFVGFASLLCALPFVFPMKDLAIADNFFFGGSVLFFSYLIFMLIKAIRKKVHGSIFAFIGIAFVVGTILMDLTLPPGTNIIPIGMFIFTIFQSLVIAERHSFIVEQNKFLYQVASRDGMTNLYKKEHFRKLVKTIIEDETPLLQHGMMFLDIDNFKTINDTYGHDAGDELIISISQKLLRSLRYSDIAGRYGGDEFIAWLHNTTKEDIEMIAQRVLDHISEPIQINDQKISASLSIGISFYPEDGDNIDLLTKVCDQRMYIAKSKGKNQYNMGNE